MLIVKSDVTYRTMLNNINILGNLVDKKMRDEILNVTIISSAIKLVIYN